MSKLGIIFGGRSSEHEISLMSAVSVMHAVDPEKFEVIKIGITRLGEWLVYDGPLENLEDGTWEKSARSFDAGKLKQEVDFAFPVLHGPYGEDGTIQGLFEMLDIPYAGCGVLASALAMDKSIAKDLFAKAGIPVCKYVSVYASEVFKEEVLVDIEKQLGTYPFFVKPANMGSSIGISKAKDRSGLVSALSEAAKYDRRLLVEEAISGRELETAVMGNEDIRVAAIGEICPSSEFYDYKTKYFDGGKSRLCVPADIKDRAAEEIVGVARKAYRVLDCAGFSRFDFFMENGTDKIYLNEINTIPGFTKFSMFPLLWEEAGVTYPRLVERIVELGYERHYAKNHR